MLTTLPALCYLTSLSVKFCAKKVGLKQIVGHAHRNEPYNLISYKRNGSPEPAQHYAGHLQR